MRTANQEKIKDGDVVTPIMTNDYLYKLHYRNPQWYPKIGTKGAVISMCDRGLDDKDAYVNWPGLGGFFINVRYLQKVKEEDT